MKVFLYGNLMAGESLHWMLDNLGATLDGVAMTAPGYKLYDTKSGFPAMSEDPKGQGVVYGEVYDVPDDALDTLDATEAEDGRFKRGRARLVTGVEVVAYIADPTFLKASGAITRPIITGNWKKTARQRGCTAVNG